MKWWRGRSRPSICRYRKRLTAWCRAAGALPTTPWVQHKWIALFARCDWFLILGISSDLHLLATSRERKWRAKPILSENKVTIWELLSPTPTFGQMVHTFDFLHECTHSRRRNAHEIVTFFEISNGAQSSHIFRRSMPPVPLSCDCLQVRV